jgi:hypothetical protein
MTVRIQLCQFPLSRSGEADTQGITKSTGPGQNPISCPLGFSEAPISETRLIYDCPPGLEVAKLKDTK